MENIGGEDDRLIYLVDQSTEWLNSPVSKTRPAENPYDGYYFEYIWHSQNICLFYKGNLINLYISSQG